MSAIRTERRFGVTAQLEPHQRRNLNALRNSEVWDDLLDVMEQTCIEVETELLNTSVAEKAAVLARHQSAQNAWKIFTHFQEKILLESSLYLESVAKKPPVPELTPEEQFIENTLDPLQPLPPDDYMGIG
jgi:hypothetical protein